MLCEQESLSVKWMQPPSPGAISLSQLAVIPALPLHATASPKKTLHALISASPWLPRHLEVIIQQSTPQSVISIMKHHILFQCPALALVYVCSNV